MALYKTFPSKETLRQPGTRDASRPDATLSHSPQNVPSRNRSLSPTWKSDSTARVDCKVTSRGLQLTFGRAYSLEYPEEVWRALPNPLKELLADNLAFLTTAHLPVLLPIERIHYKTAFPLFKPFFYQCLIENIPFSADVDRKPVQEYLKRFMNAEHVFDDYTIKTAPAPHSETEDLAIIPFSFGKDSLTTYAVLQELGIGCVLLNHEEADVPLEVGHKRQLSAAFEKEFAPLHHVKNEFALLHDWRHFRVPRTEWGFGHLITEYCLSSVPYAAFHKARYIAFGNEKSCSEHYPGTDGFRCYPVYDQSHRWMAQMSAMTRMLAGSAAISVIEPLHELAIMKILHRRYPAIAKYQMSCFPDENSRYGAKSRWCGHCSKCGRIFMFLKALGIDPAQLGFQHDMLRKEFSGYFSLFNRLSEKVAMGWDRSQNSRDEQLFAFYLAERRGVRGPLMDAFRQQFYDAAKEREEELHKRFFGIHDSITIPKGLLSDVLGIYREELHG